MRNPILVSGLGLTILALAGGAHAMDVATFLVKADALQQKGALALFSPDSRVVMGEIQAAASAIKAERAAAMASGRRPAYCPADKASLSGDEVSAAMRVVPSAQRSQTPVLEALRGGFAKKYPCAG